MRRIRAVLTMACLWLLLFAQAAPAQNKTDARATEATPPVKAILDKAGKADDTGKYAEAQRLYNDALVLAQTQKDAVGETKATLGLGYVCADLGQTAQAQALYEKAIAMAKATGDTRTQATALVSLGRILHQTGKPQDAEAKFQEALQLDRARDDKKAIAHDLSGLGAFYDMVGQYDKSLDAEREAETLFAQTDDKAGRARNQVNMGMIYRTLGRQKEGLPLIENALPLFQAAGDRRTEARVREILGNAYRDIGDKPRALAFYAQARTIQQEIGDRHNLAITLNGLGVFYDGLGQPATALAYQKQALALFRATHDKRNEALVLSIIGTSTAPNLTRSDALKYAQDALRLYREIKNRSGEITALFNVGIVYANARQPRKALPYIEQALVLERQMKANSSQPQTLMALAGLYHDTGDIEKARTTAQEALEACQKYSDPAEIASANIGLAQQESLTNRPADADKHYLIGLNILEDQRQKIGDLKEGKRGFLKVYLPFYFSYLHFLVTQNRPSDAFAWAQKIKARVLLDLMGQGRINVTARMTAEEKRQEHAFQAKIDQLNAAMIAEGVKNEEGAKKRYAALSTQLEEAERDLQTFTDALYARYPDLAKRRAIETATAEQTAKFLPPDTALLEYIVLSDNGFDTSLNETLLFVLTTQDEKPDLQAYRIPVTETKMQKTIAAFQANCADKKGKYQTAARELYAELIAPAEKQLAGKKRLIVCPNGNLWQIPFQALRTTSNGADSFLIERFEIDYGYSATATQAAWQAQSVQRHGTRNTGVLVLANPDFGNAARFGPDPTLADGKRPLETPSRPLESPSRTLESPSRSVSLQEVYLRGGIGPLPGTQKEADAIAADFPETTALTGKSAQESVVKAQASQFRYLHFATHGYLNNASPLESSIVLAQPPAGDKEDGFLTAREIFNLDLSHTEMAVLSACNTARGVSQYGEGVIGLTWAMFAAGVPTQIVTQWSVDDIAASALMQAFYANLKAGQMKGQALRNAEIQLLHDSKRSHPFYWAAFVLSGDWQ